MYASGHPARRFDAVPEHIVIGIFFVVAPRIVTEHRIDFQRAKEKDQAADQLVSRDVAHAVVVVVQREIALQTERAGLFGHLTLISQDVLADRARLANIVAHIVVGGADHVARVAFANQLGHRARAV